MYRIELYEDKNGYSEINEYFEKLQKSKSKDDRIKANKIDMYLRLLAKYGLSLKEPHIKHIDDEIWELRPLRDRLLFAYYNVDTFIVLNYFVKQTKKTPKREIEKAKNLLAEYKKSRGEYNEKTKNLGRSKKRI